MKNIYDENLRNAFNDWSENYEDIVEKKLKKRGYSYDELCEIIIENIKGSEKILELGTGPGIVGKRLRKKIGKNILLDGVDISDKMLKKAIDTNAYNNLYNINSSEYISNKKYNAVYSSFMFHSVEQQEKLLNNIYENLEEKGKFILIDLMPKEELTKEEIKENAMKNEYGAYSNYLKYEELIKLISKTKFKISFFTYLGKEKDYNHYMIVLEKNKLNFYDVLEKVRLLHIKNNFKKNGGEDKNFRLNLMIEELGEMASSITKDKGEFSEENADLFILLLGNVVAYNIDILELANNKLKKILNKKMYINKKGQGRINTSEKE